MKIAVHILFCLVLAVVFVGCSEKNVFVLLPDQDGKVGSIEVANNKGNMVINAQGDTVEVAGPDSAPKAVAPMGEEEFNTIFRGALGAEPRQPQSFLLYFKTGGSELTDQSAALFPEILESIRARDSRDISVIGHSDRAGSKEYNFALSTKRAEYVRDQLVEKGADASLIDVSSHGEGNPLIPTEDDVEEPRNRRVEVVIR
ncbi:MAG: OmpA family protein [Pseudomonadota bacterium]